MLGLRPSLGMVLAADDPGADMPYRYHHRKVPTLPMPLPGPQHHPAEKGMGGVERQCQAALQHVQRPLWPQDAAQLGLPVPGLCQPSRVGDAKLSWPPCANVLVPTFLLQRLWSPRICNLGLEPASNLVRVSGAQSGAPRGVGLLGMNTSALSSAAKCTHGLP